MQIILVMNIQQQCICFHKDPMAKIRKKGKVGKPYIGKKKKNTPKQPHCKYQTGYQPWQLKVSKWYQPRPRPQHQDHPKPLPCVFYALLGSGIYTGAHRWKTANRPQLSSKQSDYRAKGQRYCWSYYLEGFLLLRISCSLRRWWNHAKRV
jgi:hypothetical protein